MEDSLYCKMIRFIADLCIDIAINFGQKTFRSSTSFTSIRYEFNLSTVTIKYIEDTGESDSWKGKRVEVWFGKTQLFESYNSLWTQKMNTHYIYPWDTWVDNLILNIHRKIYCKGIDNRDFDEREIRAFFSSNKTHLQELSRLNDKLNKIHMAVLPENGYYTLYIKNEPIVKYRWEAKDGSTEALEMIVEPCPDFLWLYILKEIVFEMVEDELRRQMDDLHLETTGFVNTFWDEHKNKDGTI